MGTNQTRNRNPNWKGGRVVDPRGYVLIKVGVAHHLADVRGYAYEHRLVAEQKIGRRLRNSELVHHIDENKENNHPDNLQVLGSVAEHLVEHRGSGCNRRLPGQPNPLIKCRCGCGADFRRFDDSGRPRDFVSGHNPHPAPAANGVLALLVAGPMCRTELADRLGADVGVVATTLSKLKRAGLVTNRLRGVWQLTTEARTDA